MQKEGIITSAIITSLVVNVGCDTQPKIAEKPNIIFIMADDLGYGELGCYGQKKIETPHIDALAETGKRYTNFYSGSPVSAPSRSVLMTGLHSGHTYIRGNHEWSERGNVWNYDSLVSNPYYEGQYPLKEGTPILANVLKKVGYKTAAIGKWGLGAPLSHGNPNKMGFDLFVGHNCQRIAHTFYPTHIWKNDKKIDLGNGILYPHTRFPKDLDTKDPKNYEQYVGKNYCSDTMFHELIQFVKENKEHPFFLYWPTTIPHVALHAPKEKIDYYVKKFGDEEPYLGNRSYTPARYPHATYAAMVSYLDDKVGILMQTLKDLNIYDNTLVIFTSDNGPSYAGGADSQFFESAGMLNGDNNRIKGHVYEGGIRVPFIASFPGRIKPQTTSDFVGSFQDIMPTVCELADITVPKTDGVSLVADFLDKNPVQREYLYWEFPAYGGQQAVRMGKWKAVRKNIVRKKNLTIELYNLDEDLHETTDLASQHPDIVKKMEQIMTQEHVESEVPRFRMAALGDSVLTAKKR